ncbi:DsbA family protein [Streptomyces sp. NBC_00249]|uniref:DsbA family protein n=1 Tax=Streptomyces sp. NBC_00249 TaxID=2975690 RepID=UPI00224CF0F9|nr:thioredoxin domain-containing protein [Streptomyces sp. NBC_00249]MCX5198734.1 DsbA family protein [Streptomyces sp. NBC_00249]
MVGIRRRARAGRVVAAVVAAALLGAAATGCGGGEEKAAGADVVRTSPIAERLAKLPAVVDGAKVVVGNAGAPRTVQVLVDPHCGYCAKFEAAGGQALLELAGEGKVRVEYLLASFLDRGGASGSVRAVNALRASVDAGKFAEYQAAVFASRPKGAFTDELLLRIADRVPGLRGADFDRAVADGTYEEWVGEAEQGFEATGMRGTPAVLVDGKPVGTKDGSMFDAAAFAGTLKAVGVGV